MAGLADLGTCGGYFISPAKIFLYSLFVVLDILTFRFFIS